MQNLLLPFQRICLLSAIGVLGAAPNVLSVEPEQLKTLAKDVEAFAWSLKIESSASRNGSAPSYLTPRESHFKSRYAKDLANKKVQTWDEYWGWVKTFYKGNFLDKGWAARSKKLTATPEMISYANVAGRVIAAEWAKDNDSRKIVTADVRRWAEALEAACIDDSNGKKRLRALRSLAEQSAAKFGKK